MANNEKVYSDNPYWINRWKTNEIWFHTDETHPMLVKHLDKIKQNRSNLKFLIPLCGKSVDIKWLASLGFYVVGVELVEDAILQFFRESKLDYNLIEKDDFKIFSSQDGKIKIYCGDFFKFTPEFESLFDGVFDRGSLVALPRDIREKYADHIQKLLDPNFRYILDTFIYDPKLFTGPPHLVTQEEVEKLYGSKCKIEIIDCAKFTSDSGENSEIEEKEVVYLLSGK